MGSAAASDDSIGGILSHYSLPPRAARHVTALYACDPSKAKVQRWHGATISTRTDGCSLLVHMAVGQGAGGGGGGGRLIAGLAGLVAGGSGLSPVEMQVEVGSAVNMTHARIPGNGFGSGGGGGGGGGGSFVTVDAIRPGEAQLVCACSPVAENFGYSSSTQFRTMPSLASAAAGFAGRPGAHSPPALSESLFSPYNF